MAGTIYQFVQTKREWFFGTEQVWIGEACVAITDPERTLLDGLSRPQHCGDFSESPHAFDVRGFFSGTGSRWGGRCPNACFAGERRAISQEKKRS